MRHCVIARGDVVVNSDSNDVNNFLPECRCEHMILETCPCYPEMFVRLCPRRVEVSTRILACSISEKHPPTLGPVDTRADVFAETPLL